jgi:16S rRNA (adenine1518-N6/adenine1519-N6)-dimethyltransferase
VLQLTTRTSPPEQVKDEKLFFRIVRAAFNQRRKTLPNALASGLGEFSKQELQNVIIQTGFSENIRGEALSIHDFAQIANALTGR